MRGPSRYAELMPAPSPARRLYLLAERHQAPRSQIVGAVAARLAQDLGVPVPTAVAKLYPEHLSPVCRTELEDLFDRFPLSAYGDPLAWAIEALEGRRAHRTTHHTPPLLAELMVDLAGDVAGTVYDPAAGTGGLLLAAAARNPGVTLIGQEIDPVSHTCALINAELAGIEVNLGKPADTLSRPQHSALAADLVLANPPWKRGTNRQWVEHCVSALAAADGHAVLLLPASVGTDDQGGWTDYRAHLVTSGLLRAVISLPRDQFRGTATPGVVWVLERGAQADGVQLIDARSWEGGVLPAGARASVDEIAAQGWQLNPAAYAGETAAGTTLGDIADIQSSPSGEILGSRQWLVEGVAGVAVVEARNLDGVVGGAMRQVSEAEAARLVKYRVEAGDLLIARRGRLSRVAVVGAELAGAVYGTSVIRVRPRAGVESVALVDTLRSPRVQEWLHGRSTGSTLPHVTAAVLDGVPVYSAGKLG